jgi:hypothetical protein
VDQICLVGRSPYDTATQANLTMLQNNVHGHLTNENNEYNHDTERVINENKEYNHVH